MKKQKTVLVVTGTRAEYGLLRPIIELLKKNKVLRVEVLVTGLHVLKKYGETLREVKKYTGLNQVVRIAEKDTMLGGLVKEISGIESYLKKKSVDAIIVLGDRDEPLAAALVGVHLGVPIVHISGGDVSGPTVDNFIRNIITQCAQLHLVQTKVSYRNVVRMIGNKKNIHVVGSVGLDGIDTYIQNRQVTAHALGVDERKPWCLVALYPTPLDITPLSQQIAGLVKAIKKMPLNSQKIILYPNNDTGSDIFIKEIEMLRNEKNIFIKAHLERSLFLSALKYATVFIGNSSAGLIEGAYLKTPYVLIGNRQQGRELGPNVITTDYDPKNILRSVARAESLFFANKLKKSTSPYFGGTVAQKCATLIVNFVANYEK